MMSKDTVSINDIAGVLKVHPRTILRHLKDDVNAKWKDGSNQQVSIVDLAMAYFIEINFLTDLIEGNDELLTPAEAITCIEETYGDAVPERTFRYRRYPAAVRMKSVVRHSRKQLKAYHAAKFC